MNKNIPYPKLPTSREECDSGWGISWLMVVRNANKWTKKQRWEYIKKRQISKQISPKIEVSNIFINHNGIKCFAYCICDKNIGVIKKGQFGFLNKEDDKIIFIVDGIEVSYYHDTIINHVTKITITH